MRKFLLTLLVGLSVVFAASREEARLLNQTVELTQYSGATETRIENDDLDSEVYFQADASL